MTTLIPHEYPTLLGVLKERIRAAQYRALSLVNKELIGLYWDIGRAIEERQEREGWGKSVVERLSADLQSEFGAKSGFSTQNLWYMRNFYREYSALPNLQPLVGEVSWSKHLIILARCKMPLSARANSLHTAEIIDVVAPQSVTNHAA